MKVGMDRETVIDVFEHQWHKWHSQCLQSWERWEGQWKNHNQHIHKANVVHKSVNTVEIHEVPQDTIQTSNSTMPSSEVVGDHILAQTTCCGVNALLNQQCRALVPTIKIL